MSEALVTPDTDLMLHPTPRRYLTAIEELRSRKILILPTTDHEVEHRAGLCRTLGTQRLDAARRHTDQLPERIRQRDRSRHRADLLPGRTQGSKRPDTLYTWLFDASWAAVADTRAAAFAEAALRPEDYAHDNPGARG